MHEAELTEALTNPQPFDQSQSCNICWYPFGLSILLSPVPVLVPKCACITVSNLSKAGKGLAKK